MLVLSRKVNEEIIIGDDINIKIVSVQNGIVKLGFDAPQDKIILRGELKRAIIGENLKALNNIENTELTSFSRILQTKK
ncbi:carbon storage regulator [Helicobacter sp. 16-1353]|uniref:carbon storage regulator CsrA n=1 Tax=Helicobacter sp. 16-1353 TaxID=2004996 RepID=UPI000DCB6E15|nr:carbon storage regulator CsrA [Helicobacter sp. 16-1353]RAX53059.1 carbon storage regulator [Helicobacter sp. 16-1353]